MPADPIKRGRPCWIAPRHIKGYSARIPAGAQLVVFRIDRGRIAFVGMSDGTVFLDGSTEIAVPCRYLWPHSPAVELEGFPT